MFTRIAALATVSALSLGMHAGLRDALANRAEANEGRIFGHANIRRHILRTRRGLGGALTTFDPKISRWTGKPHEHRTEIARRSTKPGTPERRTAEMAARAAGFSDAVRSAEFPS